MSSPDPSHPAVSTTTGGAVAPGSAAASSLTASVTDGCCHAPTGPTDRPGTLDGARWAVLTRRVRLLVAATITYNIIEAIVAITAERIASSTALVGFGLDSTIEVASAAAVAWQLSGHDPETRERTAPRVIAISFFGLAAYVIVESIRSLLGAAEAEHSTSAACSPRCPC